MTQILPCPFCGGEACVEEVGKHKWIAICADKYRCGTDGWFEDTRADAIAAWNRRAESADLAALRQQVTRLFEENKAAALRVQELEAQLAAVTECAEGFQASAYQAMQERKAALAQLAAASQWQPLPDGEYIHDSIIDGRIVLTISDNGETIQAWDTDGYGAECIHLQPFTYRLCRLSPQPQQQGLDFPDSPGWWAFEGKWTDQEHDKVWQYVFLAEEKEGVLYAVIANDLELPSTLIGKWFRLYMPWEQPQPLAVPADVHEAMVLSRETVTQARLALEHVRCDIFLNFPHDWQAERSAPILAALKEFDAYAAWLDAHSPQEVIGE